MATTSPSGFTAIRPLLLRIGLDEKEVEVYLALLSLKVARASAVAKAAKQERSHVYLLLRNLEEKGLVSEIERGKVIHFIAEPPERLLQFVENREQELHSLKPLILGSLPILSSLTKPLVGTPRVTTLRGMEGMRQLYRDALSHEICGIFNPEALFKTCGGNIVTSLFGASAKLRGRDLLVQSAAAMQYIREVPPSEDYQIRLLPKNTQFDLDAMLFEDTLALFAHDNEGTIIRMENKNISDAFRAWFEILWLASSPVAK
jgi:predicted DNA-binding transcriptional regulator